MKFSDSEIIDQLRARIEELEEERGFLYQEIHDRKGFRKIRIGTAVFVNLKGTDKFLLGRRSDTGEWALPGGHLEVGETMEECGLRECQEEFDINIERIKKLTFLKGYSRRVQFDFVTLYFTAEIDSGMYRLNEEHTEAAWFSIDNFPESLFGLLPEALKALEKDWK